MTGPDRPSTEFLSEAQDVIEEFSRNLLELDGQQRAGQQYDPDLLNAAFRSVHSLKGLAGLFNAKAVADLSHSLENTLDALRLGKLELEQNALDVLFEAVETFQRMLAGFGDDKAGPVDIDPLLERIMSLSKEDAHEEAAPSLAGLDESILGVLTEYEEHRLRENIRMGRHLYRVHASFDLLAIDVGIEALKGKMKTFGEVITYLPSADASSDDRIDLDILVGSERPLAEIAAGVAEDGVTVFELTAGTPQPPPPEPTPAPSTRSTEIPRMQVDPEPLDEDEVIGTPTPITEVPAVEEEFEEDESTSLRSFSQTVRVDLSRLDHLMNLIGELGVVQANLGSTLDHLRLREGSGESVRNLQGHLRTMARKLSLLQQGLLDVRMVPLGQVFEKLRRVVRNQGRKSGKDIKLGISGAQTELDKLIVEELSDPLMHMIRNGIDHGIETREERIEAGKPPSGRIDLRAFQRGNRVVIEIEDDGRGMDWRKIRDTAIKRGVTTADEAKELSDNEVIDFVFQPGFTTRDVAGRLSGRGVGMDVVKTNISRMSGMIDIETSVGKGTKFSITLPVTLAIIQALVIETCRQTFCIPLNSVLESIMVRQSDIVTVEGHEVISLRGRTLPLLHLSRLFDLTKRARFFDPERIYVVIVGLAQHRVGLVVDELVGQQDVVIKPLGSALRSVPGIAGATELGANRTVLLLDVSTLVDEALTRVDLTSTVPGASGPANEAPEVRPHGP